MSTIEKISRTADLIKKIRPSYQSIIEFYSQVFQAQEKSKQDIVISPVMIEADLLEMKQKNLMPLIDQAEFLIDLKASKNLFIRICGLAIDLAPRLSSNARMLKKAEHKGDLDLKLLFSAILNNRTAKIHDLSEKLDILQAHLLMFGYLSMAPGIETCSEQLKTYLADQGEFKKGYCPVCGNPPDLAFLDQDGNRHLKCCFCNHQWLFKRMGCVFCENNDEDYQHYFFNDEEKEYRVNLCDHCHNYIKLVDLRQMDRAFYPGLEMVSTLHLDMKAKEKGYTCHAESDLV